MLPEPHARWLEGILGAPSPAETTATCAACAMAAPDPFGARRFPADLKCCTFLPALPNFQVGALLADPDPALAFGQEEVRKRIRGGHAITPMGVFKPRVYHNLYRSGGFGQSETLRCPYFRDGGCGIWSHRESVCSTWFCKHDRGRAGGAFWHNALKTLLAMEQAVAATVAVDLGIPEDALNGLVPADVSRARDPEYYDAIWAGWHGREEAFFVAAGERGARVGWEDAARWARIDEIGVAVTLRAAHAALAEPVPDVVALGRLERTDENATIVRLGSYSPFDPVDLPRAAADALPAWEGRPTADLGEIGIDPATVRRLADDAILLPTR